MCHLAEKHCLSILRLWILLITCIWFNMCDSGQNVDERYQFFLSEVAGSRYVMMIYTF